MVCGGQILFFLFLCFISSIRQVPFATLPKTRMDYAIEFVCGEILWENKKEGMNNTLA